MTAYPVLLKMLYSCSLWQQWMSMG